MITVDGSVTPSISTAEAEAKERIPSHRSFLTTSAVTPMAVGYGSREGGDTVGLL